MSPIGQIRRLSIAGCAALVVVALAVSPVLAETEKGHHGLVGDHKLNESSDLRVICGYDATGLIDVLEIHPVSIWSRDTTAGRDKQKVGWQFIVQRQRPGQSRWRTFWTSSISKAPAWNDQTASFPTRQTNTLFPNDNSRYRVWSKMLWYRHGAVEGTAVHQYDYYQEHRDGPPAQLPGTCPGHYQV